MWKEVDTVIYYIHPSFVYSPSLAMFNFMNTILKPDKKNSDISEDLTYCSDCVKPVLQDISEKGASIIIFQSFNHNNLDGIKLKFEKLINDTGLPLIAFFSTAPNKYSKPFTNIWKLIELIYKKNNIYIDKLKSIYVGNKAGRINALKRKIDYSCADRAFASNVGLNFYTPEILFQKIYNVIMWECDRNLPDKNIKDILFKNNKCIKPPIFIEEINKLPKSDNYLIIITGTYTCGKTTMAEKIKRKWDNDYKLGDIVHLSENNYDVFDDLECDAIDILKGKKSVIVDTTGHMENIHKLVRGAMINKIPVLIGEIKISIDVARLLSFIKVQTAKTANEMVRTRSTWDVYYSNYMKPNYLGVPCVRYLEIPFIVILSDEYWYEYSY